MASGEEAAIFNALKADAEKALPDIAKTAGKFADDTASTAEKSLDAHAATDSNIAGDLSKITDKPAVIEAHSTTPASTGQTTEILKGLTKEDDAAAAFKPKDEAPNYSGNQDFRSTAEDRANFKANYHGYADDEEYVNALKAANPDHPIAKIPTEDLVAVRGYTGDEFYSPMNKALRTGDTAGLAQYDSHIRATTSGLNQLEPTAGTFHRGMNIDPAHMDDVLSKYEPGQEVTEPYFMSTGKPFPGNVQYEVQSATGRDVSYLSHYPKESEVLFPPGSRFRVDSKIEESPGNWKIKMTDLG